MIKVDLWGPARAGEHAAEVYQIYDKIFGDQPDQSVWRTDMYDRHRARDGFRLSVAHDDSALVGFAWGYLGERGQFWSDFVVSAVPDVAEDWVGGHFEFVELAVLDSHRRRGVGVRLHDRLLEGVSADRALLGTDNDETSPAVRLYQSRGWSKLGELNPQTQLMGIHLHQ